MKIINSILISMAIALFFSFSAVAGSDNKHTSEAIKHAQAAADEGKNAKAILGHAEESLKHATAALPELTDSTQRVHITESIRHLEQAIAHAKDDNASEATKHVNEAIVHLKDATK